ncbi:Y4yA family PLP-dependent enzyme [Nocardia sp. NPDC052001]|uniref:Y4yA family PLP-dependent enzyme n=1 Tax=Nocardia sp. NPDC052001 TaxID=3154853 RepID=UPI00343C8153
MDITDPAELTEITATPMPAHRAEWEELLLADTELLGRIAGTIDGAFHVLFPARIVQNIKAFQDTFVRYGVTGRIYYGKKANKGASVVRACRTAGAGVDVASVGEFQAALGAGIAGTDLVVTGPAKSDALLALAVREGALIAIDGLDELDHLHAIVATITAAGHELTARILLRVLPPGSHSRFGLTGEELDLAVKRVDPNSISLEGFSFHLSGYRSIARAELAAALIPRCLEARGLGHRADTLSIGGGFGVDYVPEAAWRAFIDGVNPAWFHGDRAPAPDSYYPYHCPEPGPDMLAAILRHDDLGDRLRTAGITLAIEPGRALLDRAGSTVFTVQGRKTRTAHGRDYQILTVNGTSLSLSEQWFNTEYLPDPALWPRHTGDMTPACVGGATCLEDDMLSRRRIPLPRPAEIGDLLIYPNTAGYQMDSNESAFHDLPIPPKVELSASDGNAQFGWRFDR